MAESECQISIRDRGIEQLPFAATGPKNEITDETTRLNELVQIWHRCSTLMHRTCESAGIRYFHFLQSNQYLPDSKPLSSQELKTAVTKNSIYREWVEKGYPALKQDGDKLVDEGVSFFDLTMAFSASHETVYIDDCCHFGTAGNEILADAI